MIVTVAARHMDVTEPMKSYAQSKANKLTKYFDRITEIEVVINHTTETAHESQVEMIVNAEHNHRFVAHCNDGDAYACIDGCIDKLERQLTDHKEKLRNRKHPDA